ncbi:hypothetical protein [Ornithinimicrobium kibberense]|uniref:hypothetical protein n=1 Tax=Ornithinimicrobium kibberense TaxID=282060 RepID=UPI00361CAA09
MPGTSRTCPWPWTARSPPWCWTRRTCSSAHGPRRSSSTGPRAPVDGSSSAGS